MSSIPPPPYDPSAAPYGQAPYYPPPVGGGGGRPTSVTVIAVLAIIFGVLGILYVPLSFAMESLGKTFAAMAPNQNNPALRVMTENATVRTFTIVSTIVGGVLAVLELAGGIGSLKLRPWARTALLAYAVLGILAVIVYTAFTILVMVPAMTEAAGDDPAMRAGAIGGAVGGACAGVLGMIFPIFILIFYNRPRVKAAFAGTPWPPGGATPVGGMPGYPPGPAAPSAAPYYGAPNDPYRR